MGVWRQPGVEHFGLPGRPGISSLIGSAGGVPGWARPACAQKKKKKRKKPSSLAIQCLKNGLTGF